ncbi:T9SS type A sorting domain-containing protein [Hymenobacter sp. BT664]|uniref:T9SS type A sorting domain-containing protein n=1 Tax=Hymenobacter montanus TaxID=2771359 RepID=A0A927GKA9_9BACT|nr:T9SS type A sorting domain-containing protein [Hymenobacter montanus]MBD2769285.1 T9SS type A sorting domain-containing protein [Hymenobacter montanus]
MKELFLLLLVSFSLPVVAQAQDAILPNGVAAPKPAAPAPAAPAPGAAPLIAPAPETPAANPNAIKVKAEVAAGRLTVKTDNPGPTRIEVTDVAGRPVLTYTMMNGQTPALLNVKQLPAGSYIVRCSAYEKSGMRRVVIGK